MGLDAWLYDSNDNEIIYWRKENHFHRFFCENGESTPETTEWTGPYIISRNTIEDLIKRIDTILATKFDKPITKRFSNGYSIKTDGKRTDHFIDLAVEYDEEVADVVGWELARVRNIRKHYVDAARIVMGLVSQLENAEKTG